MTHRRQRAIAMFEQCTRDKKNIDALLVTKLHNARYLTGFTGSNASVLLHANGDAVLFTDPRYTLQASQQSDCRVVIAKGPMLLAIAKEIARKPPRRLGFESDHVSVTQFEGMRKEFPARVQVAGVSALVERLRMVKDEPEIATIRSSVIANSSALEEALAKFQPGMTEMDLASEIDYANRRLGAEAPSFDTIVAAAERSALPHAHPGDHKIGKGIVLIDMGAFHRGYASDMTRMVHVGAAPAQYRKNYAAVLEAQLAATDAIRPGATALSVDRAARKVLQAHGLDKQFIHSTGHGLGLEIHEPPRLGRKDKTKLEAGMVITVEPGIYIEGWGGIRIEDTVLVTRTGHEVLTPGSKRLRVI